MMYRRNRCRAYPTPPVASRPYFPNRDRTVQRWAIYALAFFVGLAAMLGNPFSGKTIEDRAEDAAREALAIDALEHAFAEIGGR